VVNILLAAEIDNVPGGPGDASPNGAG
jgi:hypothetical protein